MRSIAIKCDIKCVPGQMMLFSENHFDHQPIDLIKRYHSKKCIEESVNFALQLFPNGYDLGDQMIAEKQEKRQARTPPP